MRKALLVGKEPPCDLGYSYTTSAPYDGVVIGSLTLGQLLRFDNAQALEALAEGKSVILYTPGLPEAPREWWGTPLRAVLPALRQQSVCHG